MSVNCSVCNSVCDDKSRVVKCVGNCGALCHTTCVPQKSRSAKKEWACDSCKLEKECSSSLSSSKSATVSVISKEFLVSTIEAFKQEMLAELKKNTAENAELRSSLSFLSDTVDKNNKIMDNVMKELKRTQEENAQLRRNNMELQSSVRNLEVRVRNVEQYSRKQNIEIDGVPETQGENVIGILSDVARAIGVEMKMEKVVAAHRIPSFNRKKTSPIIVRFSTYEEKDTWLTGFKNVRPLTANRINSCFNSVNKVFVNEHLSPENKQLLSKSKEAAIHKNYKYVWSRDGKIFVCKNQGEKCKKIETLADLEKL